MKYPQVSNMAKETTKPYESYGTSWVINDTLTDQTVSSTGIPKISSTKGIDLSDNSTVRRPPKTPTKGMIERSNHGRRLKPNHQIRNSSVTTCGPRRTP